MFWAGLLIISFAGAFIQVITGFGAAVAVILFMSAFTDMSVAPSAAAGICLALNFTTLIQYRKAIKIKPLVWPIIIYSAVSLLVIAFIKSLNVTILTIIFGAFLILLSVFYLFWSEKIKINADSKPAMAAICGVSGIFAGLFSVGGPTLALYYLSLCGTGEFYLASLQLTFLFTNIVLCIGRVVNGLLTVELLPIIIVGAIGALIGQLAGSRLRSRLNSQVLQKIVYISVGLSGLVVILQHIL